MPNVHKNSRHMVEIKSVTEKGFGVGEIGGFVVFVDGALPDEKIDALIVKVKKNYGYGKIMQIVKPSPFRVKSTCGVAANCGGCQFRHCEYSAQLAFKKQFVITALEKIGGFVAPPVLDVIGMENPSRYRNKAVFPVVPARQARSGHRGHVSESTHSLEAVGSFPAHEKARQARSEHRGHVSESTHSLEAVGSFPAHEKKSRRVSLADSFLQNKKARQERSGHRGHVSAATHSLEAGGSFLAHKKIVDVSVSNISDFSIGMYAARSHRLIEVDDCEIQHESHVGVLAVIKEHMRRHKISAYDEIAHKGLVRHIVVRTSFATHEVMVTIVLNGKKLPHSGELVENLAATGVTTVLTNKNTAKNNTIFDGAEENFRILHGTGFIREKIGDIEFELSAPSFFQVNPVQTKILYEIAIAQADLNGTQYAIDAHCGVGTVTLYAAARQARNGHREHVSAATHALEAGRALPPHEEARQAHSGNREHVSEATHALEAGRALPPHEEARQAHSGNREHVSEATHALEAGRALPPHEKTRQAHPILGIDIVPAAISDAKKNAAKNGITNAEFICGATEEVLPKLMTSPAKIPDIIFLDPPRKGCDRILLDAIISAKIPRVVYISCDPATFARDAKILAAGGYSLDTVQPVDMFPHTGKVETVSLLRRADRIPKGC
ncbi:MAG: class I SAM-dependent RNA methyltransferase [Defluviitaleaceae bacterium]|nr:class I SAM-dependent RNA methyltransferase [Defluviitaleaceae bacterium]